MNWAWPASSTIMSETDMQYKDGDYDFLNLATAEKPGFSVTIITDNFKIHKYGIYCRPVV